MTKVMNTKEELTKSASITDVDSKMDESNAPKTVEELNQDRGAMALEIDKDMEDLKNAIYEVDFVNESNISNLLKLIDKGLEWTIKEAAMYVNLYESIKSEKARIKEDKEKIVRLSNMDLNTLYTMLTSLKGTGIEKAKSFLRLLTGIGNNISVQMNKMADNNRVVQDKNSILSEMDSTIEEMQTPALDADEIKEDKA